VPEATAKKKRKAPAPEEVTNFMLSPDLSQWLVGAISRMATQHEIEAYLALTSDEAASAFIDEFWARRGPEAVWPNKSKRQLFEERSAEADRLYDEGTYRGRHTDRGTIYVLYGPPDATRYEESAQVRSSTVEVWTYSGSAAPGLDDKRPRNFYMFMKQGDLTVEYRGAIRSSISQNPSMAATRRLTGKDCIRLMKRLRC
jgi:GWxTD domain-containing protein